MACICAAVREESPDIMLTLPIADVIWAAVLPFFAEVSIGPWHAAQFCA
jgi:hypothetical protein